jgi:hypothetical protein
MWGRTGSFNIHDAEAIATALHPGRLAVSIGHLSVARGREVHAVAADFAGLVLPAAARFARQAIYIPDQSF